MNAKYREVSMPFNRWETIFICILFALPVSAQQYNFNIGAGPGFPLPKASDFASTSYNFVAGGGPNLLPHIKMNAEFMFHGLPIHQSIIDRVGVSKIKGRLYSLTGNLIVGSSVGGTGGSKGVYLIGGGGWYRRTVEAQQTVLQAGEICEPVWIWWNVQCVNGIFPTDVTIKSSTSSAGGFNVGGGLSFRLGESSANIYAEVRYHRAFTRNVDTTVLPVTFGVRW
jgi:hypothetical protein